MCILIFLIVNLFVKIILIIELVRILDCVILMINVFYFLVIKLRFYCLRKEWGEKNVFLLSDDKLKYKRYINWFRNIKFWIKDCIDSFYMICFFL